MDRKPSWLQVLIETIGIPTLIAVIIGVPAIIIFIQTIWHSLGFNQQIIAGISGSIFLLAVIVFFIIQTRKKLLVIPNLLHKMHCIKKEHSAKLSIDKMESKDLEKIAELYGIDLPSVFSSLKDVSQIPAIVGGICEKVQSNLDSDPKAVERIVAYTNKKSGLDEMLNKDKEYSKLSQQLSKIRNLIPTEEMSLAVNNYIRASDTYNSITPLFRFPDDFISQLPQYIPIKIEAEFMSIDTKVEDEMNVLLAKVRESIIKYYKGK